MRNLLSATALAGLVLSGAAFAQTAETPQAAAYDADTVVATVNGTDITLGHVILMLARLPEQIQGAPDEQLFPGLVEQLVDQTLLADKAAAENAEDPREVRLLLENERRAALAMASIRDRVEVPIEEAELQAAYDASFADFAPQPEFKASHILVETEERATELLAEIEAGADFAELAREKSTGPSGASGGDLGWFGAGDMVESFFNAVAALEPGEISAPVQTDFGWHVITLAETRNKERPAFDTVQQELASQLQQTNLESFVEDLTSKAEIDKVDLGAINPEVITNLDLLEN